MKKQIMAVVLSIAILFSDSASVFACDRKQTETYVSQMLFGDKAEKYKSNEKVQMLMKALYLCSEQYDDDDTKELSVIKGMVPSFDDMPAGCAFCPRCPEAREICRQKMPELVEAEGRKVRCFKYTKEWEENI